jgi:hypothetical protein
LAITEELLALASAAGRTVVAAAATDAWTKAKEGISRVLGRGDPARTELTERRLDETHNRITQVPAEELASLRMTLAAAWETRLTDLLEENPSAGGELKVLVAELQADVRSVTASAADYGIAAARDINITATGGAFAAGTVHGNVSTGNPTRPGLAQG